MRKVARWTKLLWGHAVAVVLLTGMAIGNLHHLWRFLTSPLPKGRGKMSPQGGQS